MKPELSIVIPTFNRCGLLAETLQQLLSVPRNGLAIEIIVVDNNSTDSTPSIVAAFAEAHQDTVIRYTFEGRQGLPYARNAGIFAADAPILAFLDDDLLVAPAWIQVIHDWFSRDEALSCICGKVVPKWLAPPPGWLTKSHWSPIAVMDSGDEPFAINHARPICLMGGNFACRRSVFDRVGVNDTRFRRCQDHELTLRLIQAGLKCMYVPDMAVSSEITADRMRKSYHRRWHRTRGKYLSLMSDPRIEASRFRILGVPGHMWRGAVRDIGGVLKNTALGREAEAFSHEVSLQFFSAFSASRFRSRRVIQRPGEPQEVGLSKSERVDVCDRV